MSEQSPGTAVEGPFNDAERELQGLVSFAALGGLPAKMRCEEGTVFVVGASMNLPAFLHGADRVLVVIEATEYRELVSARTQLLKQGVRGVTANGEPAVRLGLSTIERDQEVADFLRERFHGGVTLPQLRDACLERFGVDRTPSIQRISGFRRNTRRAR